MKRAFVTGGAGFIGSNLVRELLAKDFQVSVCDNLCLGKEEFIGEHLNRPDFKFIKSDLLDLDNLKEIMANHSIVFHMAANSHIEDSLKYTDLDLRQGTIATYNVLEAMRLNNIKEIVFASSSAVYGEAQIKPTPEDYGPLFPISLYGASKLASEALITAFCDSFDTRGWIFRFANIVGDNGTHGVLVDFINKLRKDSTRLEILGDGKQAKPYLYVKECIDGMIYGYEHSRDKINCYNLGCKGKTSVDTITDILLQEMQLQGVKREYTGGRQGWKGDVPEVMLDTANMDQLGWSAKYSSDEAVGIAVKALLKQL